MALIAPSIATIISGNMAAAGILGVTQPVLATALSLGFSSYLLSSVIVNTADAGALGSGTGIGQGLILSPSILRGSLTSMFSANGIAGVFQQTLIQALSNAYSQSLLTATINTVDVGVGIGTGVVVSVIPNTASHMSILFGAFRSAGINGVYSQPLITALATGIDAVLPSSRGFTVIAGAGIPTTGVGVGIGKLN
jgi:hypothetical protein